MTCVGCSLGDAKKEQAIRGGQGKRKTRGEEDKGRETREERQGKRKGTSREQVK